MNNPVIVTQWSRLRLRHETCWCIALACICSKVTKGTAASCCGALQVLPRIDGVSVRAGSEAGGQLVSIKGRGFGTLSSAIHVDVSGIKCEVVDAGDDDTTCVTAPGIAPAKEIHRGGAGVFVDYYAEIDSAPQ